MNKEDKKIIFNIICLFIIIMFLIYCGTILIIETFFTLHHADEVINNTNNMLQEGMNLHNEVQILLGE